MASLRCYKCGKLHIEVEQFGNVHQAGLSLKGTCKNCDTTQGIGKLFSVSKRIIDKGSEQKELIIDDNNQNK